MRVRCVELEFRTQLRRTPKAAVLHHRQIKTAIVAQATQNIDAFRHHRFEKRAHRVLRIHIQQILGGPAVRGDKGFDLLGAETGRASFRRHPGDLQGERPGTFADALGQHRQANARLHPVRAVDIADAHCFHLRTVMTGCVEDADFPLSEFLPQRRRRMRREPFQAFGSQCSQPVVGTDLFSERLCPTSQRLIQAVMVIGEQHGAGDFDGRAGARADRESINNIEQDRTTAHKTGGDCGTEILYTLRRGTFLFLHTTSLTLEGASWGRPSGLPSFVQTRE